MSSSSTDHALALDRPAEVGRLRLGFRTGPDGDTYVAEQYAAYPFHLGRVHYLDTAPAGMATVYLQSSAGGIYAGDRLAMDITAAPGARAHVTTQAPTIIHRTVPNGARQHVAVTAADGAFLEYMPDTAILFPGASLSSTVDVTVGQGATVIVQDAFLGHDPKGADAAFDMLESTVRISDPDGRLLALDRYRVTGAALAQRKIGITGDHPVHGTMMVVHRGADDALADALREGLGDETTGGASTLPNDCGAWARVTATDGASLNAALATLWAAARTHLTGQAPKRRRK